MSSSRCIQRPIQSAYSASHKHPAGKLTLLHALFEDPSRFMSFQCYLIAEELLQTSRPVGTT
jgi:hypothetical protein